MGKKYRFGAPPKGNHLSATAMKTLNATDVMATLFMSYQLKVSPLRLHHENLRVTYTIQEEN